MTRCRLAKWASKQGRSSAECISSSWLIPSYGASGSHDPTRIRPLRIRSQEIGQRLANREFRFPIPIGPESPFSALRGVISEWHRQEVEFRYFSQLTGVHARRATLSRGSHFQEASSLRGEKR